MDLLSTMSPEVTGNVTSGAGGTGGAGESSGGQMLAHAIKLVYVLGIVGNAAAILTIRRGERRVRNRKHLLLLTSLAANDLVALVGMMGSMVVAETLPWARRTRAYCAARVVVRVFGVGSVCIAVTMAMERYLALTRPFLYQKQVTYYVIRTTLLVCWSWAAVLTCVPILGLGLYYDQQRKVCVRYRNAEDPTDFGYAVFYVMFGTFLCVILVYCNLAVIRALYAIIAPRPDGGGVRRVSKTSCRQRERSLHNGDGLAPLPQHNVATAEEVYFSRLMATLSVLFMVCWLPQMITSVLYLSLGKSAWDSLVTLATISDLLMLFNYVLNPVLYVLMRRSRLTRLCRVAGLARCCCCQSYKSSNESVKSSCCPQETLLVSEHSSGAELRPLGRPLHHPPAL